MVGGPPDATCSANSDRAAGAGRRFTTGGRLAVAAYPSVAYPSAVEHPAIERNAAKPAAAKRNAVEPPASERAAAKRNAVEPRVERNAASLPATPAQRRCSSAAVARRHRRLVRD